MNATALTACRTTLQSGQIGVEVTCPSADLAWLEEFLSPTFCARSGGGDIHYGVEAVVDEGADESLGSVLGDEAEQVVRRAVVAAVDAEHVLRAAEPV